MSPELTLGDGTALPTLHAVLRKLGNINIWSGKNISRKSISIESGKAQQLRTFPSV